MRIVSGKFGGRILKDPVGHRTHPMSEKVRGALFNALGDIDGVTVLDAFAGTGSVGIEALSRGAEHVAAVEVDKAAFDVLRHNRDLVASDNEMSIHRANVSSWLANNPDKKFDIVIADPPYDKIQRSALQACAEAVIDGGLLVLSLPPTEDMHFENLERIQEKTYGDAKIVYFRRGL